MTHDLHRADRGLSGWIEPLNVRSPPGRWSALTRDAPLEFDPSMSVGAAQTLLLVVTHLRGVRPLSSPWHPDGDGRPGAELPPGPARALTSGSDPGTMLRRPTRRARR
jgi:hypothetical protein